VRRTINQEEMADRRRRKRHRGKNMSKINGRFGAQELCIATDSGAGVAWNGGMA
jgi:hypothetical protein